MNRNQSTAAFQRLFFLNSVFVFTLITVPIACAQQGSQGPPSIESSDTNKEELRRESPFKLRPFSPVAKNYRGKGISFGPFRKGQKPGEKGPTSAQVKEDLKIIAKDGWQMIRTYGTEPFSKKTCEIIRAEKLPIKLVLGAWIATEKGNPTQQQSNKSQIDKAIALANKYPDVIAAVSVANESQVSWSFHKVETDTLIQYIRKVRSSIKQPVTVADDFSFWSSEESKKVSDELDFIVTHAYAMWLGQQLEDSLSFTQTQYKNVRTTHPKKVVVLGEFGWATQKANHGEQAKLIKGKPGVAEQKQFFDEHMAWLTKEKIPFFYFEAFDEPWKGGDDPAEVEKHWGLYYENRTPKNSNPK